MASIFTEMAEPIFWNKVSLWPLTSLKVPILTGTLKSSSKISKTKKYELHPSKLFCTNTLNDQRKFADLRFRVLQPFIETKNDVQIYGFSIDNKDFFVQSEEELNRWLKVLRPMCIQTNLEDDFVLLTPIGTGSSGSVYLGEDLISKKQVAIKCIQKSKLCKFKKGLENLKNEISILQDLSHERISQLFAVYESEDSVYMVMEYLPEGTLCKRLNKKEKFDEASAKTLIRGLLETLDYLHKKNIVHRDLKLENLMMVNEEDNEIKLIDFGLAFNCSCVQGSKCGSPGYVAPEIMLSNCYNSKVDVFSAGVVLYLLLVGKHPFEGRNDRKIMENNIMVKYKISKKISMGAQDVVRLMLTQDPELRPSARELLQHPWISSEKDSPCCLLTSVVL